MLNAPLSFIKMHLLPHNQKEIITVYQDSRKQFIKSHIFEFTSRLDVNIEFVITSLFVDVTQDLTFLPFLQCMEEPRQQNIPNRKIPIGDFFREQQNKVHPPKKSFKSI